VADVQMAAKLCLPYKYQHLAFWRGWRNYFIADDGGCKPEYLKRRNCEPGEEFEIGIVIGH